MAKTLTHDDTFIYIVDKIFPVSIKANSFTSKYVNMTEDMPSNYTLQAFRHFYTTENEKIYLCSVRWDGPKKVLLILCNTSSSDLNIVGYLSFSCLKADWLGGYL